MRINVNKISPDTFLPHTPTNTTPVSNENESTHTPNRSPSSLILANSLNYQKELDNLFTKPGEESRINIILDPVSNNNDNTQPANNTPSSGILAIWQKALNYQKRLEKLFYGPGAIHGDRANNPNPSIPSINNAENIDSLSAQIAHQAQEILDNKNRAHKV